MNCKAKGSRTEILGALITHPQGMTRTDVSNFFNRNYVSERISKSLQLLESLGHAYMQESPTDGRPKELWFATHI